MPSRYCRFTHL